MRKCIAIIQTGLSAGLISTKLIVGDRALLKKIWIVIFHGKVILLLTVNPTVDGVASLTTASILNWSSVTTSPKKNRMLSAKHTTKVVQAGCSMANMTGKKKILLYTSMAHSKLAYAKMMAQ
jgi:hypothetical protein